MSNVTCWTENEVNVLVQAWAEVEAKYPSLRCQRGTTTLHAKVYALFSRRCTFVRSSIAVNHMKNQIRNFLLFVQKFDEERRQDGERLWFELTAEQREQHRRSLPKRVRGLTSALSKEAYVKLLKMERVQRWLGGGAPAARNNEEEEVQELRVDSRFISPASSEVAASPPARREYDLFSESDTSKTEQDEEKMVVQLPTLVGQRSNSSTCSLDSSPGDESSFLRASSPPAPLALEKVMEVKKLTPSPELRAKFKHRDCNILLENMMELQNKKVRKAVTKLRADVESEIQRSSEMLRSIISNQFEDPENSGDVAFLTKVLTMQEQQIRDRFDQFMEKRTRDEAENRSLLGQRYHENFDTAEGRHRG